MALVRVGGEPDGRQAIRRLIQFVSILVVMDAEVVGGAIDSGNVSVVDAAEGVAAFFQHILHRVAGVIGDILRFDEEAVLRHRHQGDLLGVRRQRRRRQQRQQHTADKQQRK